MLPFSSARATTTLLVGSVAALLMLPATAMADNPAPHRPTEVESGLQPNLPPTASPAAQEARSRRGPAADRAPDDGSSSDPATSPPTAPEPALPPPACEPHLATFTRDGTVGSATAIALTSQAIDRDVAGWLHVSWEAAPGTNVTAISVTHTDGRRSVLSADRQGTVAHVLTLTFCGEQTGSLAEDGRGLGTADTRPVTELDPDGDPDPVTNGDPDGDPDPVTELDPDGGPDPVTDGDLDDAAVERMRATSPSRDATAPDPVGGRVSPSSGTTEHDATLPVEEEVEVLGVQIVAPPRIRATNEPESDPGATGDAAALANSATSTPTPGIHPLLVAAAIATGLAGAGTVLHHRRPTEMTGTTHGGPT